jgi:hypothetical protein
MAEKREKQLRWLAAGLLIVLFIAGSIFVLLNRQNNNGNSSVPSTDPETGIQMWIEAVNGRNIDRLYDLAPDEIHQQVTLSQFKEENINNIFLQSGNKFLNYSVIDKKQNGTYAQIMAQVLFHRIVNQSALITQEDPLQYKFVLNYQHGEWKIWTQKWQ